MPDEKLSDRMLAPLQIDTGINMEMDLDTAPRMDHDYNTAPKDDTDYQGCY